MPTDYFFGSHSAMFLCAEDGGEWKELPTLSDITVTMAPNPEADITPSNIDLSFTATCSGEFPRDLLVTRTRLPRKMKKAAKTLYFARRGRVLTIMVNHTPKTKRQRIIARKCGVGKIMTPKGEILEIEIHNGDN